MNSIKDLEEEIKKICENYKDDAIGGWAMGSGPIPCDILFIGEAPGKTEVEEGKPFVGAAGKNFQYYLDMINLNRKDIRITNTCYFRPIKIKTSSSGRKTISNRPPKTSEINLFQHILKKEIETVNPKIIITLGNTPLKTFDNYNATIGHRHGSLLFSEKLNMHIFPMYHPSALIYNRTDSFKESYKEDWCKLADILKGFK
ncbi:uracil-DNA glycosylase [Clostridium tetani]|nr:uracil-DNA glycosylase [Clostridium tetani]KGI36400.1 uracil-DNA glycosylase [Clostridium tetani ATCC 9441]KGI41340.1 uracil-DNA glycosylase [Clostridium tetani]WFN63141.1 uracil-DNA glycosylase [Clostridium tetani]